MHDADRFMSPFLAHPHVRVCYVPKGRGRLSKLRFRSRLEVGVGRKQDSRNGLML